MFKPAAMTRIRLIVHKEYAESVMAALQDMGVVQIEALPEHLQSVLTVGEVPDYKKVSDYAQRFRGLESALYTESSSSMFKFGSMTELLKKADSVDIDARVASIRKELDSLAATEKEANSMLALLEKMKGFSGDLSILNTENITSFVVSGTQLRQFSAGLRSKMPSIVEIPLATATIFSIRRSEQKAFSTATDGYKLNVEFVPKMRLKADAAIAAQAAIIKRAGTVRNGLEEELRMISKAFYPLVNAVREQLDIEVEKYEVYNKLGSTASTVALEGWVPTDEMARLERGLKKVTMGGFILERIKTKDAPPTKFKNPVSARLFESFVKFYSIPKSGEIDPTLMFTVAFPIFFGLMVGDAGYGLFMLALALWLLHRLDHPPKKSHIPRAISGFITMIVSPDGLRILAKSITPGAILAIAIGAAANLWFGFSLPYTALFSIENSVPQLLLLAGWIGVFMVCFGFVLGFLNKLAEGEKKHAISKLGWLAAAIGFVILGLNVLHKADLGIGNLEALASYALLVGGIITIVKFEGPNAIMELPSLISHMLSYTRLVGILLASVILASVIDLIFMGSWHHSILLGIVGTFILIVGQLFNITIAMFEPGIQGARLIYVEFFSKFYEGNGRLFKPFSSKRRSTLSRYELE